MNRPVSSAGNENVVSFALGIPGFSKSFIRMSGKDQISGKSHFLELFNQGRKEISSLTFTRRRIEDKKEFQLFSMKFMARVAEKWPVLSASEGKTFMPNTPQGL